MALLLSHCYEVFSQLFVLLKCPIGSAESNTELAESFRRSEYMTTEIELVKDTEVPGRTRATTRPWAALYDTLSAAQNGEWARLPMSTWPGSSRLRVQQLVQSSMRARNLGVQTRTTPEFIYVRLRPTVAT
jgi:hypothetical protein